MFENEADAGVRPQVLSVGVLSADLMNLGRDIAVLEECGVQLLHFDVMDGRFVPSLTVGVPFVKGIKTAMYKDVHLMIEDPLDRIAEYVAAGADMITIHPESSRHSHRVFQLLGELENANDPSRGIVRGIALNPSSPLSTIEPFIDDVETIFLVAINPAFPNQSFIESTKRRFDELKTLIRQSGKDILTGIDGGVTKKNIAAIAALGPDFIVTGSAVFEKGAIKKNLEEMSANLRS